MKKIIVGADAGEQARDALRLGEALSRATGSKLIVAAVHEIEPYVGSAIDLERVHQVFYGAAFRAAEKELGRSDFAWRVAAGSAPGGLEAIAREEGADLIVVGSTSRGKIGQVLAGSVGERLMNGAPCSVAIAPNGYSDHEAPAFSRIGCAFDGEPESREAALVAAHLARQAGARLTLIAVAARGAVLPSGTIGPTNPEWAQAVREFFADQLRAGERLIPEGVDSDSVLLEGDPASELSELGSSLDLLVLGSRGYGPVRRALLGAVAWQVVRTAPCPQVLVVPPGARQRASR